MISKKRNINLKKSGFTIVELLVVIVVIGILAAITMVSYTGITIKAKEAGLKSDLSGVATVLEIDKVSNSSNTYPATLELANGGKGVRASNGNVYDYIYSASTNSYILTASNGDISYYITSRNNTPTIVASFVTASGGTNDETGVSIAATSDGGYVALSNTSIGYSPSSYNVLISKYTADGTLSWNKTWGDDNYYDVGVSIAATSDGGYVITGMTDNYSAGSCDMFIAKYTTEGTLSWSKTWGGVNYDTGESIVATNDGGFVVTGTFSDFDSNGADIFISKYTADGTLSWNKILGESNNKSDTASSITITSDGGYVVSGQTNIDIAGAGAGDILIAKYTAEGALSWTKTWGGTAWESTYEVVATADGGFAVTGFTYSYSGAGDADMLIAKYTADGTLSWNKTWGGANYDTGRSIAVASDGGYVVTGYTNSFGASYDMFIAKYTADGTLSWNKTWGGDNYDSANSIAVIGDGGYVVTGYTSSYGAGGNDMYISKYKSNGDIIKCSASMCKSPTAIVATPSAVVSSPLYSLTNISATMSSPIITTTTPSITTTIVVAP